MASVASMASMASMASVASVASPDQFLLLFLPHCTAWHGDLEDECSLVAESPVLMTSLKTQRKEGK